jgi:hypothetical protein
MKKVLCAVAAGLFLGVAGVPAAMAASNNTGCGLGSLVFENPDTVLTQILAATTNGTLGSQTFGITSGTSNCDKPAAYVSNERLERFVAANMDTLAQDIAAGSGERLTALGDLLQIPAGERAGFASTLKANFAKIYPAPDVQAGAVIDAIIGVIS